MQVNAPRQHCARRCGAEVFAALKGAVSDTIATHGMGRWSMSVRYGRKARVLPTSFRPSGFSPAGAEPMNKIKRRSSEGDIILGTTARLHSAGKDTKIDFATSIRRVYINAERSWWPKMLGLSVRSEIVFCSVVNRL